MKNKNFQLKDFGKIMQDMYQTAYYSNNGAWFLKKKSFEDGTYTFDDYLDLKEDIDYLKENGVKNIEYIIESVSPKEAHDTVAIFYVSFLDLFEEIESYERDEKLKQLVTNEYVPEL